MQWPDRDEAFLDVTQSVRKALEKSVEWWFRRSPRQLQFLQQLLLRRRRLRERSACRYAIVIR